MKVELIIASHAEQHDFIRSHDVMLEGSKITQVTLSLSVSLSPICKLSCSPSNDFRL